MPENHKKEFVKGNEAIARGAIAAGCRFYFGYPITPQNDIPEYLSRHLPKAGGTFLQAESEIASINMVMGASAAGMRAMTSSSGPGISLKQEGISYMAGSQIPCVVVNISRSSPGLGGISPSQADYFQATRGGGHGDYRVLVIAPASVQEMYDLTILAFELADKYRNPAMILGDAVLGQMKEPLNIWEPDLSDLPPKEWALTGAKGRNPNILKSLYLGEGELEAHCWKLHEKYQQMKQEVRYEEFMIDDAEIVTVAFGSSARITKTAIRQARREGIKVGLLRPITLFPFPEEVLSSLAERVKYFLVVELNTGQMVEDVRISVGKRQKVAFYGRPPGVGSLPSPEDILQKIKETLE